jgi:hypothetical protein
VAGQKKKMAFDEETQKDIETLIKMLDGSLDVEKDLPKKRGLPGPEQMKMYL